MAKVGDVRVLLLAIRQALIIALSGLVAFYSERRFA